MLLVPAEGSPAASRGPARPALHTQTSVESPDSHPGLSFPTCQLGGTPLPLMRTQPETHGLPGLSSSLLGSRPLTLKTGCAVLC